MDNILLWYATRASGLVALLLLTLVVLLGILGVLRFGSRSGQRFAVAALHRNISLVTVAFLAVHITSSVVDTFVEIDWPDAVIPFGSAYRPVWLGLGAAAFDLLVALIVTSLLRPRISQRLWRRVHWAAYAMWPLALAHSLGTGTDSGGGWSLALVLGCLGVVLVAAAARLVAGRAAASPDAVSGAEPLPGRPAADRIAARQAP